ncbi:MULTISPECIES: type II secretion system F family protein [Rhizobium/Agrobacterium group]|jgi:tight adherence protein B|uniref:type II secretion system F family protein n=1 Tax=Rhizobium/Agrobacterium group TaxID=227290 RepID=UPI000713A346|nr:MULTISPECIES: type II secretion system F family protein [Rhizobium/Agrobacterium group]KQY40642.1 pilus assembly protein [Rhizobium sp. Root483D2]
MFGIDITILAIVGLVALSTAGLAYGILFTRIETEKKAESRVRKVKSAETDRVQVKAARDRVNEMSKRRKSVQDSLKDLEKKQQEKSAKAKPSMKIRLIQAGFKISMSQFYIASVVFGAVASFLALIAGMGLPVIAGIFLIGSAGFPRWFINFMIKRRAAAFLSEFPNALDIMVRSIKSGLPLNDAIRLIAGDGMEPVKTEFKRIIEAQQVGLNIPEACARMINTMPLPEVNFFAIVIAIQAQAGGNLSEALGNLSKVLRERKKMKAKVQALSMEAKASACIIGALPFIVAFLVYMTSPDYMMILFTDPRGHLIMGCSLVWMSIGIWVMRNMITFDI